MNEMMDADEGTLKENAKFLKQDIEKMFHYDARGADPTFSYHGTDEAHELIDRSSLDNHVHKRFKYFFSKFLLSCKNITSTSDISHYPKREFEFTARCLRRQVELSMRFDVSLNPWAELILFDPNCPLPLDTFINKYCSIPILVEYNEKFVPILREYLNNLRALHDAALRALESIPHTDEHIEEFRRIISKIPEFITKVESLENTKKRSNAKAIYEEALEKLNRMYPGKWEDPSKFESHPAALINHIVGEIQSQEQAEETLKILRHLQFGSQTLKRSFEHSSAEYLTYNKASDTAAFLSNKLRGTRNMIDPGMSNEEVEQYTSDLSNIFNPSYPRNCFGNVMNFFCQSKKCTAFDNYFAHHYQDCLFHHTLTPYIGITITKIADIIERTAYFTILSNPETCSGENGTFKYVRS